ncbi:MAG TPA: GNAT family N-acetyltransferase [Acidisarcina sp.]|nr:GNAT family N-acetyltransferase [Acidisarcina sp.]
MSFVLETERLYLRPFAFGDDLALFSVLGDAETMRYYPRPRTRLEVVQWVERFRQSFFDRGVGLLAVCLKSSGQLIGDCGTVEQEVDDHHEIEVGYHVHRDLWNLGIATEAAKACIDYTFRELRPRRVISLIRPENLASRRVAEKNGLAVEKVVFWRGYDHCIYQLKREDAHPLPAQTFPAGRRWEDRDGKSG